MRLIFLDRCISQHAHVIVYVEVEQGARLSACLGDQEGVECIVLEDADK